MTVEQLLELERKQAAGSGVIFEDTGSPNLNYYKAVSGNDPEINKREQARIAEGEQKVKQEASKAAGAILGLALPSTYINTALDWSGKEKMPDWASIGVDLALPLAGGAIKKGLVTLNPVLKNYRVARTISKDLNTGIKDFKLNPVISTGKTINYQPVTRIPERTSLGFFERPTTISDFEKLGIPSSERNQLGSFKSELNWNPQEWFNIRKTLEGDKKYNSFDVMSLQSHLPEYLHIEQVAKDRGIWLKNNDGSNFIGDPRSWVQLRSQNGKIFDETPIYSGIKTPTVDPTYNGQFWGTYGQGKISAYQARAYAASDDHVLELTVPKYARTYNTKNQEGRVWFNLQNEQNLSKTNDIAEWAFKNGYDRININNVLDVGPESGKLYKSKYKIFDSAIDDLFTMSSLPQNDVVVDGGLVRKSILGNNGNFNIHNNNIYRKQGGKMNYLEYFKKGGIHIKESHKGRFTDYCGGKVTNECIAKGKASKDPKVRKMATFAQNARKWN